MSRERGHKQRSRAAMTAVLLLQRSLFLALAIGCPWVLEFSKEAQLHWSRIIGSAIVLGTISSLLSLLCLGLLTDKWRARGVHWRWEHPLPGSRAFTEIGPADHRVDMDALQRRFGDLPTEPAEQNPFWYRIYMAHPGDPGIADASKAYLAARDLTALNLLLTPTLSVALWFALGSVEVVAYYAVGLLLFYALTAVVAQNYGVRLVQNALAVASSSTDGPTRA